MGFADKSPSDHVPSGPKQGPPQPPVRTQVVGSDGKIIEASVPRFLKSQPWYVEKTDTLPSPHPSTTELGDVAHNRKRLQTDQSVQLQHSRDDNQPAQGRETSKASWDHKRDRYDEYNSEEYEAVIEQHTKHRKVNRTHAENRAQEAAIVDHYSRVVAVESHRELKDTAHYLRNVGAGLEFDSSQLSSAGAPGQAKRPVSGPSAWGHAKALKRHIDAGPAAVSSSEPTSSIADHGSGTHNLHTAVFGSWWVNGTWGYKCCKSLDVNSTCLVDKHSTL